MSPATTTTRSVAGIAVGDVLPELSIPLTRTLIVTTAIASRDYQDVHHDPSLAIERGSPDIFMNILSTNGLVGRYITDWTGPGAVIESVAIRLGAPNHPGDTMVFTGTVTSVTAPGDGGNGGGDGGDGRGRVEIAVRGANSRGDHVTGVVRVSLPTTTDGGRSGAPPS